MLAGFAGVLKCCSLCSLDREFDTVWAVPVAGTVLGHPVCPEGPTPLLTTDRASLRSARTPVPVTTRDEAWQVDREDSAVLPAGGLHNQGVWRRRSTDRKPGKTFCGELL